MARTRFWRSACIAALVLTALAGCNRKPKPAKPAAPAANEDDVDPPAAKPEYSFAAGLEQAYPEVVGFLRHFLATSLVGDYSGYRRLVARAVGPRTVDPESRGRFEKILYSLRALTVESIEPLDLRAVPPPLYLVTARAEFDPSRRVALRRGSNNRVAILVLKEDDEWRMAPAPEDLQPRSATESASAANGTTQPAAPEPNYPWDRNGDY